MHHAFAVVTAPSGTPVRHRKTADYRSGTRHAGARNQHSLGRPQRRCAARLAGPGQGCILRQGPRCNRAHGFCYPSLNRRGGDKPPRPECAPTRHDALLDHLSAVELVLVVRVYAQRRYLGRERKRTLTEMVVAWEIYAPHYIPLPHPNWRNNFSEIKPLVRRRHNPDATRTCRTP